MLSGPRIASAKALRGYAPDLFEEQQGIQSRVRLGDRRVGDVLRDPEQDGAYEAPGRSDIPQRY